MLSGQPGGPRKHPHSGQFLVYYQNEFYSYLNSIFRKVYVTVESKIELVIKLIQNLISKFHEPL